MLLDFIYALLLLVVFVIVLCIITSPSPSFKESDIPYPKVWPKVPTDKGSYASLGERYMIECAECIFQKKFEKCRPTFLKNDLTGRNLELDGYCSEIGIALEYNGMQHYVWPNFTKCSFEEFEKQVERDEMKRIKCENNGICLIVIPYTIPLNRIPDYLYSKVIEASSPKNVV